MTEETLYEIFDTETGNLVGAYATRDLALADVFDTILRYGSDSPAFQSLALGEPSREDVEPLKGAALLAAVNEWVRATEAVTERLETAVAALRRMRPEEAERLQQIQARLNASKGPYYAEDHEHFWTLHGGTMGIYQILKAAKKGTPYAEYWPDPGDAALLEHSYSDLAFLVEMVHRLTAGEVPQ